MELHRVSLSCHHQFMKQHQQLQKQLQNQLLAAVLIGFHGSHGVVVHVALLAAAHGGRLPVVHGIHLVIVLIVTRVVVLLVINRVVYLLLLVAHVFVLHVALVKWLSQFYK